MNNDVFLTPCTAWKKMLAATHPDDLTPEAYRQLQAHLASCPTCSAIRAEYESMGRAISLLPRIDQVAEPSLALATLLNASIYHDDETQVGSAASSPVPIHRLASFHPVEHAPRRRIYKVLSALAAVLIVAAVLGSFGALIASRYMRPGPAAAPPSWQIVPSANPGSAASVLLSVAALSENDAWAVGYTSFYLAYQPEQTLIEHWNGTQWSVVTSPNSDKAINILNNVVALSADDVWAVGGSESASTSTPTDQPLIEHWNGRQWSIVSLPLTTQLSNARSNTLSRLAVLSPDNVWGIGSSSDSAGHSTALIVHWNGSVWTIVPSPDTGSAVNGLRGIVAISPNDIWAVGFSSTSNFDGIEHALIEHWDGTQWSIVPSPEIAEIGSANMSLNAVTAVSTNDVWAIGASTLPVSRSLIEHWDGTRWSIVTSPNVSAQENFGSLTMLAANDIWAVGVSNNSGSGIDGSKGLILHWDGRQWRFVSSPNRGSGTVLSGIGKIPGSTNAWAAGYYTDANNKTETLMLRYK